MRKAIFFVLALTAVAVGSPTWLEDNGGFGWNEAVAASYLVIQSSRAQSVVVKVTPNHRRQVPCAI